MFVLKLLKPFRYVKPIFNDHYLREGQIVVHVLIQAGICHRLQCSIFMNSCVE